MLTGFGTSRRLLTFALMTALALGSLGFFVHTARAVGADLETSIRQRLDFVGGETGAQLQSTDIRLAIAKVIRYILGFVGVIFLGMLVYGGFTWMFSGGNEIVAGKAINIIQSAVIGLLIVLLSFAISTFVISRLQASTYSDRESWGLFDFEAGSGRL